MLDDALKTEIKRNIEHELKLLLKRVVVEGLDIDTAIENCREKIAAAYSNGLII